MRMNHDLWPEVWAGWAICSWLGHSYTVNKMSGQLCSRCRRFRRYPA